MAPSDIKSIPTPEEVAEAQTARTEAVQKKVEAAKKALKYGKTPVVYIPTKGMVAPVPTPGLGNLIQQATSVKEVNNLLQKGKTEYKKATPDTIRKWEKAAQSRIAELSK